jgi:hypothetical protein
MFLHSTATAMRFRGITGAESNNGTYCYKEEVRVDSVVHGDNIESIKIAKAAKIAAFNLSDPDWIRTNDPQLRRSRLIGFIRCNAVQ